MSFFATTISPTLISLFETLFSVQLTDETARIRDVLSQLDTQLFKSYTTPHSQKIHSIIESGIFSPSWAAKKASATKSPSGDADIHADPSPYVLTTLLHLVTIHTESSTTVSPLTPRILRSLTESLTTSLITTFQSPLLPTISLAQLLQATLDVEFLAQTLAAYTSEAASQTQSDIYQVLDRKTDNRARVRLQDELGGLRKTLKGLREGTRVQFACFRRERRREDGGGAGGASGGAGR